MRAESSRPGLQTKSGSTESLLPEFSVVIPCLNEAETLALCVAKAHASFHQLGIRGEVIVADNGSSDGSPSIARRLGARVVHVASVGYGTAVRGGVAKSLGRYVIMGDADDSYDFSAIRPFVERLREGYDLVVGNRFRGGMDPGAMPWTHRWIGNPALTAIGRLFFRSPLGDFHCGLRGFSRVAFERMHLQTTGMEFASEMVVKSSLLGLRIGEVPVVLHKDGRSHPSHLRTWRDGWRHLRFMLLFSPAWLFLVPGSALLLGGLLATVLLLAGPTRLGPVELDVHALVLGALVTPVGYQVVVLGVFTKGFAAAEGLCPRSSLIARLLGVRLEVGLVGGIALLLGGIGEFGVVLLVWNRASLGDLGLHATMRHLIPSILLVALGLQTIFASFFLGTLSVLTASQPRPDALRACTDPPDTMRQPSLGDSREWVNPTTAGATGGQSSLKKTSSAGQQSSSC